MRKRTETFSSSVPAVNICAVQPDDVDRVWPYAAPFLLKSYHRANQDIPASLRGDLRAGRRVLWLLLKDRVTITGAGITAIFDMRQGRTCKIEHFGARGWKKWLWCVAVIEDYARLNGCDNVRFEGRLGWERLLRDYRPSAVLMEKRL
jgi:hypothetical protein